MKTRHLLRILDLMFHAVHSGMILFVLGGWMVEGARKAHLITLAAILFSWSVLGKVHGFGYCIITDYHWRIKRKLNQGPLPKGYVKYMLDKITGRDIAPNLADNLAYITLFTAFVLTLVVNFV